LETKRIFIAINLKEELKEYLFSVKHYFILDKLKIKWVEKENIHLTLKFIGETNQKLINLIDEKLKEITSRYPSFEITFSSNIGLFPSLEGINYILPRVIWVGIEEKNNEIKNLHHLIEKNLSEIGIPKENKKFSSHITLGRIKYLKDKNELINLTRKITINDYSQKIKTIELMESKLTPNGPQYNVLNQYFLMK